MSLTDYFYYDETSQTCLRWKIDRGNHVRANSQVGGLTTRNNGKKDYSRVKYLGKKVSVSRIIWEIFNGSIPDGYIIDHLDGDKWNNKISNLELKTQQLNCQNMARRSDNKSGITGISVRKQIKGKYEYNYVFARVGPDNKDTKVFSIDKLGFDLAMKNALNWRLDKIKELNSNGSNYTERHVQDLMQALKEYNDNFSESS